jgi:hypothetical protein
MANEVHLARLKQGVEAWNTWWQKNPRIQPDLSRTNFTGLDLEDISLHAAARPGLTARHISARERFP